jgi:anti-sigma B factor antagonist
MTGFNLAYYSRLAYGKGNPDSGKLSFQSQRNSPPTLTETAARIRTSMSDLNFTTRQTAGITVLELTCRIALGETSSALREILRSLVDEGKRQVVIDLAKVTTVDSSGLGTLVAGFASLEKSGGQLKLANLSPKIAELMTITKLYTVFEIFDDERAAVDSFKDQSKAVVAGHDSSIL